MFGFSSESIKYHLVQPRASSRARVSQHKKTQSSSELNNIVDFKVAIDGPPSPERIRAYTEQMKRDNSLAPYHRTLTLSSVSSSLRSRQSTHSSSEGVSLSRWSSARSSTSKMTTRREKPESLNLFGRLSRRARRGNGLSLSSSSLFTLGGNKSDDTFEQRGDDSRPGSRRGSPLPARKRQISEPYNFQHILHTRQEQFPVLQHSGPQELVHETSAVRASRAPSQGEVKGIGTRDQNFEDGPTPELPFRPKQGYTTRTSVPHHQRGMTTKSYYVTDRPQNTRVYGRSQSYDNLRLYLPPRTPQSPTSTICPVEPPLRTSSRSVPILHTAAPNSVTSTDHRRPYTSASIPRNRPFNLDSEVKSCPDGIISHAVTTPGDEACPWTVAGNQVSPGFNRASAEAEIIASQSRPRKSSTTSELRSHGSVPSLSLPHCQASYERPCTAVPVDGTRSTEIPSSSSACGVSRDSWEVDIDYCYAHEAEAHCDYNWERRSIDQGLGINIATLANTQCTLARRREDNYSHTPSQASSIVPSDSDVPELSPSSFTSVTNVDASTPTLSPNRCLARSFSRASSFVASQGVSPSPTLLIPTDFTTQLDQDAIYEKLHANPSPAKLLLRRSFDQTNSPNDDNLSSTGSFQSSSFSNCSTSSTLTSHLSQDSLISLHTSSYSKDWHSLCPDLVSSLLRAPEIPPRDASRPKYPSVFHKPTSEAVPVNLQKPLPPTPPHHRRTRAMMGEVQFKHDLSLFVPAAMSMEEDVCLSPVAENDDDKVTEDNTHARNVSVPTESSVVGQEAKIRSRANTSSPPRSRGGSTYMLFPQA